MELVTWLRSEWDRVLGWTAIAAAVIALLLGYQGVSDAHFVAKELAYIISGGIGGLLLVAVGATLLISADLHDEWRKLDRIEDALRRPAGSPSGEQP